MKAQRWIRTWISIVSLMLLVGCFNYIVDPNGFNRMIEIPRFNKIKANHSDAMTIKFKMPLLRQGNWDNLMMGTSRIGVLDNDVLNRYLGGRTFNMEQPASVIPVQYDSFMYAVHYNKIKSVVYAVDFMSFNENRRLNDDYIELKSKLRSFNPFYTYDIYFNQKTLKKSLKLIADNYRGKIKPSAMYLKNGMRVYQNYIYAFEHNTLDMQKNIDGTVRVWFKENGYYEHYKYSPKYMKQFQDMLKYCKEHNIKVYVYISPMYIDFFNALGQSDLLDEFEHFKSELAQVTDYVDFTGVNPISVNIENFWDSAHLRLDKTDLIMKDVINEPNSRLDFGTWVNKDNVSKHLQRQKSQYNKNYNLSAVLENK